MKDELGYIDDEGILTDWFLRHYFIPRFGESRAMQDVASKLARDLLKAHLRVSREAHMHGIFTEILAAQVLQNFAPDYIVKQAPDELDQKGCDITVHDLREAPMIGGIDITSSMKSYAQKNMRKNRVNDVDVAVLWVGDIGQLQLKRQLEQGNNVCLDEFVTQSLLNGDSMSGIRNMYYQIGDLISRKKITSKPFVNFLELFYYNFEIVDFYSWGYPDSQSAVT